MQSASLRGVVIDTTCHGRGCICWSCMANFRTEHPALDIPWDDVLEWVSQWQGQCPSGSRTFPPPRQRQTRCSSFESVWQIALSCYADGPPRVLPPLVVVLSDQHHGGLCS